MDLFHAALNARVDEAQKRMAHGITRTGPVKVAGKHLSEAPNEPAPRSVDDHSDDLMVQMQGYVGEVCRG